MDFMRLSISRAMHTAKNTPAHKKDGGPGEDRCYNLRKSTEMPVMITYERRSDGSGRELLCDVDSEHGVAQQDADLKHNPGSAVQRQIKTSDVHQHEEDAGDEETHHIQQGATADQHLNSTESGAETETWSCLCSLNLRFAFYLSGLQFKDTFCACYHTLFSHNKALK